MTVKHLFITLAICVSSVLSAQVITETQQILNSTASTSQNRGISVDLSGDLAVAGAYNEATYGSSSGSIYIYERNTEWEFLTKLYPSDLSSGDEFGRQVSIDGYRVVAGSHNDDTYASNSGSAYVFEYNGVSWVQHKLVANDAGYNDNFGRAVSISGDYVLVGALNDDQIATNAGAAYVFKREGDNWTQMQKIVSPDGSSSDNFGQAVSICGNQMVITSMHEDLNGIDSGAAYAYELVGDTWVFKQRLLASDGDTNDGFGNAVAITENKIVVGAMYDEQFGANAGAVYVFEYNGASWIQVAKLASEETSSGDYFGGAVDISDTYVLVGANHYSYDTQSDTGGAFLFKKIDGVWVEEAVLISSDISYDDDFGRGVAVCNGDALIGAMSSDADASNAGSIYYYQLTVEYDITEEIDICSGETYTFPDGTIVNDVQEDVTHVSNLLTTENNDSIITTILDVYPTYYQENNSWVCQGSSYTFPDGNTMTNITESLTYTSNLLTTSLCDSIIETTLIVNPSEYTYETVHICSGESHTFPDGETVDNIAVNFVYVSSTQEGINCHTTETSVVVHSTYNMVENVNLCSGESYTFPDGTTQIDIDASFTYVSDLSSIHSCDSIIETHIHVKQKYNLEESIELCAGSTYIFPDGTILEDMQSDVIHVSNLTTVDLCDSIIRTEINVNPVFSSTESLTICAGNPYTFPDGFTADSITESMTYTSVLETVSGCDSIIETNINVIPVYNIEENVEICAGDSYSFPDGYSETGIMESMSHVSYLENGGGCDIVLLTNLIVNPVYFIEEHLEVCEGDSFTFPDGTIIDNINSEVIHTSELLSQFSCDSIIETHLTVLPSYVVVEDVEVCEGSSYTFPDGATLENISVSLIHESILNSASQCDSIIETNLVVIPIFSEWVGVEVCSGESYVFPDGNSLEIISEDTLYVSHMSSEFYCDSIIETSIHVLPSFYQIDSISICMGDSYVFPDGTILDSVVEDHTHISELVSENLCDSIYETILNPVEIDTAILVNGHTLFANQDGASYQWVDCDNDSILIEGATDSEFTPEEDGNYAVEITIGQCSQLSECVSVVGVGKEVMESQELLLYPNPTKDKINLDLPHICEEVFVELFDVRGVNVYSESFSETNHLCFDPDCNPGLYIIEVEFEGRKIYKKLIIE